MKITKPLDSMRSMRKRIFVGYQNIFRRKTASQFKKMSKFYMISRNMNRPVNKSGNQASSRDEEILIYG